MSFSLPSLQDLLTRTRQAFRTNLPGSDAWVWPNNITPTAKVIAGAIFEVFGFASYISKMIFASTAPDLETLILHGNEFGLALRPAGPAIGFVQLTTTSGVIVAVNAIFARTDGVQYLATGAVSIAGAGTLNVPVIGTLDGANGNTPDGTPLDIVSGVTGDATAAAFGDIVGGTDVEDMETFRQRILFRKRYPPHGGAASDYVGWTQSQSGVTRTYVERLWTGAGTVRVFVLMDDLYANGIAPSTEIERIADFIETVRPAGAIVTIAAPVARIIDVQIANLTPDNVAVREAALAELRETFLRRSRVSGNDAVIGGMPFLASPATFSRSWLWQAVANAAGEESHDINLPAADVVLNAGEIAVLGTVTFV